VIESVFPPQATPESAPFWEGLGHGELRLPVCDACRHWIFYPRSFCPNCYGRALTWRVASGAGRLLSYAIPQRPLPGVIEEAPYVVAIVKLREGPQMMANLVGVPPRPEALALDMPLRCVFRQVGDVVLPAFEPEVTG
jgi:uncharacterized protein